jgi:hypothetical protein
MMRWITRGIVAYVFRGIDDYRSRVTEEEREALELDPEDAAKIARPIAHIAERSAMGQKHGRMLMDSRDGLESMIAITMWANRMNRIAKKYRDPRPQKGHTHRGNSRRNVSGEVISEERTPQQEHFSGFGQYSSNGAPGIGS